MHTKSIVCALTFALLGTTCSAWAGSEDEVKQITQALSSAIGQRIGDQVSLTLGAPSDYRNAVWGEFDAGGAGGPTSIDTLAGIDTHGEYYWGAAFNFGTDTNNDFDAYGGTGYFAANLAQTDTSVTFLLLQGNYTHFTAVGFDGDAESGTADLNWVKRFTNWLLRLDGSYTGVGSQFAGFDQFASIIAGGAELGYPTGHCIPYAKANLSEFIPSSGGPSSFSAQLGGGIRGEVSETTTLGAEAGATVPDTGSAGWYIEAKARVRFN